MLEECECEKIMSSLLKEFENGSTCEFCMELMNRLDKISPNKNVKQYEPEDFACNCPNCGKCLCGDCV